MSVAATAQESQDNPSLGPAEITTDVQVRGADPTFPVEAEPRDAQVAGDEFVDSLQAMTKLVLPPRSPVLLGIGSGVVAPHGTVFASVSGTTRRDSPDGASDDLNLDGSVALGFGLGDATETVGAQVTTVVSGLEPFGDSGSVNLKFSRALGPSTFAGISFGNVLSWGAEDDEGVRTTVAVTHFQDIWTETNYYPVMFTAGYGTNVTDGGTEEGVILGAGVGLNEYIGVSASTNTEYVNLGIGLKSPNLEGWNMSFTAVDAFDQDDRQALQVAVSYSLSNAF
ncbi:hypothetical protein OG2516_17950 [Oceanicola granulosus HTCC2516]|uniref:Uncharacterized protein n=1 Tax=Oceanicola granulosus (strain ATCC BAA-861 / DSM 15982 / KCTC 12143 / HTCC2516) TaxID=314256 RepID=Q2CAE8_OCEGH|nr:hypothetical protein OG2516_17950 [Oceanicola granulosus HTCC2516]